MIMIEEVLKSDFVVALKLNCYNLNSRDEGSPIETITEIPMVSIKIPL